MFSLSSSSATSSVLLLDLLLSSEPRLEEDLFRLKSGLLSSTSDSVVPGFLRFFDVVEATFRPVDNAATFGVLTLVDLLNVVLTGSTTLVSFSLIACS